MDLQQEIYIQKAVLFGDYALGNYCYQSEINVAIFSDYFAGMSRVNAVKFLMERAKRFSRENLLAYPFSYQEYLERSGLAADVLEEGIELYVNVSPSLEPICKLQNILVMNDLAKELELLR